MNVIFLITVLIATVAVAVINPENFVGIMLSGATDAVTLSVKLVAVYAVWMSVLEMMDRAGLNAKMTKLCRPLTNALFKGESDETKKYITVNLASSRYACRHKGDFAYGQRLRRGDEKHDYAGRRQRNIHSAYPRNRYVASRFKRSDESVVDNPAYAYFHRRFHRYGHNSGQSAV